MNKTSPSKRPIYVDPIAEAQFKSLSDSLLIEARTQAQADGLNNCPTSENEFRVRFANTIFSRIQQSLDEHALRCQNISGVLIARKIDEAATNAIRIKQAEMPDEQAQLQILKNEASGIKPNMGYNLIRLLVALGLVFVACIEGVLAYPGFRAAGLPKANALFAAIGVAVAVAIAAPLAASYIRRSAIKTQQILKFCGVTLAAFFFFFCLGILRMRSYALATTADTLDSSEITAPLSKPDSTTAWAICLTSFVLFVLALCASIKYFKTKEESKSDQDYKDKLKQIQTLSASIQSRTKEIHLIEATSQLEQADALTSFEYAVGYQQRLMNLEKIILRTYCKTNVKYRSDGICPEFFDKLPQYSYTSYFKSATN